MAESMNLNPSRERSSTAPSARSSSSSSAAALEDGSRKIWVSSLRKGDRIDGEVLLVEASNFKQTRDGKYFIQLVLRDRTGAVRAVRWEASHDLYQSFSAGDFIRINGRVEEFQQNPQVVIDRIEKVAAETVNSDDFLPVSKRGAEEMERELQGHVAAIRNPHLRNLLTSFLEDPDIRRGLIRCPAGKTLHHAYLGGLLEHILSLIGAARLLAKNYPRLDADFLVAAAFLHDIGKISELTYSSSFGYSDRGQLVGHIGVGLVMIAEKVSLLRDFPEETRVHLEHIIASHHGLPEHGALKVPMTAEAIAFHFLDDLDAKMAMVEDLERELPDPSAREGEGRWTDYKPALGKRIYFPG